MKDSELYTLYPHILPGSIEIVPRGTRIVCGKDDKIVSHGRICVIKCVGDGVHPYCLKTRIINVQDVAQVKECRACVQHNRNMRRRQKRARDNRG